jgi:hypothetical protein
MDRAAHSSGLLDAHCEGIILGLSLPFLTVCALTLACDLRYFGEAACVTNKAFTLVAHADDEQILSGSPKAFGLRRES